MSPSKCCMVCGDKALGYNFNAITCESCKAFFRRNALAKKQFSCPFNQNCEITVVTRRFCQKCRLKKCFDIGMKSENIMSEEDKLIKRKKIENNRQAKRKTSGKLDATVLDKIKREDHLDGAFASEHYTSHDSQSCNSFESDDRHRSHHRSDSSSSIELIHENMSSSQIVDYIVNDPDQASQAINRLMKTPKEAVATIEKVINAQTDALRLISHLISFPGDALKIISKIMNSPFEALTVFTKFMSSPTDALEIISKIVSSPQDVLQFIKQLMHCPEDALDIMTKFMNTPAEALKMINKMVNSTTKETNDAIASSLADPQESEVSMSGADTEDTIINSMLSTSSCGSNHSGNNMNNNNDDDYIKSIQTDGPADTPNNQTKLKVDEETPLEAQSPVAGQQPTEDISMNDLTNGNKTKGGNTNSLEAVLYEVIQIEYEMANSIPQSCNPVSRELNEAELQKLNELKLANKALYYPVDEDISSLIKPDPADQDPQLLKVINLTAVAIKRLIKMSKRIAAFRNMCQEDQVALLKGGCTEMMIMRSVLSYDGDQETWKIPHSAGGDMSSIKADVLKLAKGNVYEEHERFIRTFDHKWRIDENIILILCAIVLFTPTRHRVIHFDVIKLEQNSYYYLLRRYLESVYPGCEAKSTFIKLIQKISDVERLNQVIIGVYLNVNPAQVEPLLREIFDLKNH